MEEKMCKIFGCCLAITTFLAPGMGLAAIITLIALVLCPPVCVAAAIVLFSLIAIDIIISIIIAIVILTKNKGPLN